MFSLLCPLGCITRRHFSNTFTFDVISRELNQFVYTIKDIHAVLLIR